MCKFKKKLKFWIFITYWSSCCRNITAQPVDKNWQEKGAAPDRPVNEKTEKKKQEKIILPASFNFSQNWSMLYEYRNTRLIKRRTERLQNNQIFTEFPILEGAIFHKIILFYFKKCHLPTVINLIDCSERQIRCY